MKRVFYDVETDHEHPPQAQLTLVGALVERTDDTKLTKPRDEVYIWEPPFTKDKINEIRDILCANDIDERVGFNNLNFDDLVLFNYDIEIPEANTQDAMLAIKTCYPGLPAFALKFLCWHLLGDPHWDQFALNQTGYKFGSGVSTPELIAYNRHDLFQHRAIWDYIRKKVKEPLHWEAYQLDMRMKLPLQEMTFDGGVLVDVKKCKETLEDLNKRYVYLQKRSLELSQGKIKNINSNKQVGKYLAEVEKFLLELTDSGEFQVKKKDLVDILGAEEEELRKMEPDSIALCAWQMRDNETVRKYVANYYKAALGTDMDGWIPAAYQISRAGTRRTLSKSYWKINFQNSTDAAEQIQRIPPGFLGWGIDSTQIENVVHIFESSDAARRAAYEADEEWNEYVWLTNMVLGCDKTKAELEKIKSKMIPHWSVYKAYKTAKLSLNFGQGAKAFSEKLGLPIEKGRAIFADIHNACPTIRALQDGVEHEIRTKGFVQDAFGHIYTGYLEEAYKVVAYLIQGCGTGSLPKAQLRANYETLHRFSEELKINVGPLVSTTHDETKGLLRLDLGQEIIEQILRELIFNMTQKFEHKFDGIPLRAKLYLTTTNWYDRKNHEQKDWKNKIEIPL